MTQVLSLGLLFYFYKYLFYLLFKNNKNVIKTFKITKSPPQLKWSILLTFNACVGFVYSSWRHWGGGE